MPSPGTSSGVNPFVPSPKYGANTLSLEISFSISDLALSFRASFCAPILLCRSNRTVAPYTRLKCALLSPTYGANIDTLLYKLLELGRIESRANPEVDRLDSAACNACLLPPLLLPPARAPLAALGTFLRRPLIDADPGNDTGSRHCTSP